MENMVTVREDDAPTTCPTCGQSLRCDGICGNQSYTLTCPNSGCDDPISVTHYRTGIEPDDEYIGWDCSDDRSFRMPGWER